MEACGHAPVLVLGGLGSVPERIRVLTPCRVSLPGDADVIVDKEACSERKASFSQRSAMGLVAPNYYFYLQPLLGLQL